MTECFGGGGGTVENVSETRFPDKAAFYSDRRRQNKERARERESERDRKGYVNSDKER